MTYIYVNIIYMKQDGLYLVLDGASLQRPRCFDFYVFNPVSSPVSLAQDAGKTFLPI